MNKEKFEEAKQRLRSIFSKQGNYTWNGNKTEVDEIILAKFDDLIVDAAADLIDAYEEGEDQKSEMPCNCCKEEIDAQNAMSEMVDAVEAFITAVHKLANK